MAKSKWNDKAVLQMVKQRVNKRLELVGEFVVDRAIFNISGHAGKDLQAVDTGRLMDSITYATNGYLSKVRSKALAGDGVSKPQEDLTVKIGSNVEYAPYIEIGTSKITSRPFLRTALNENIPEIKQILGAK
ncbi:MAG TPA: HK97 gp10 family phage protein [Bacteroidales bacterium]|nr:HK97 gp10 family phage protein [Bacteroidales bacterium]